MTGGGPVTLLHLGKWTWAEKNIQRQSVPPKCNISVQEQEKEPSARGRASHSSPKLYRSQKTDQLTWVCAPSSSLTTAPLVRRSESTTC
jgi:hypothetical protein